MNKVSNGHFSFIFFLRNKNFDSLEKFFYPQIVLTKGMGGGNKSALNIFLNATTHLKNFFNILACRHSENTLYHILFYYFFKTKRNSFY